MNGSRFDVYEVRAPSSVSSDDVYPPRHFDKDEAIKHAENIANSIEIPGSRAWVVCHDVATCNGNGVDSYIVHTAEGSPPGTRGAFGRGHYIP